jgi:hypothetical protein
MSTDFCNDIELVTKLNLQWATRKLVHEHHDPRDVPHPLAINFQTKTTNFS